MGKKGKTIIWILALVVIVTIISFQIYDKVYMESDAHATNVITNQINGMLQRKDYTKLKKLSKNTSTYKFFRRLPSNAKAKDTSGYQGTVNGLDYYVTSVNKRNVDIYVKQTGRTTWEVKTLEIQ